MIHTRTTNIFQIHQSALPMTIVMVHRIHVHLTFATVDQTKSAVEESIHVRKDNASVVTMMPVRTQIRVGLENAKVSNFKSPKT